MDPRVVVMRLPTRDAASVSGEPSGTTMATAVGVTFRRTTPTVFNPAPAEAAKTKGATPRVPTSTAPALRASAVGAAAPKAANSMGYGTDSSSPAACSSTCNEFFWLDTRSASAPSPGQTPAPGTAGPPANGLAHHQNARLTRP